MTPALFLHVTFENRVPAMDAVIDELITISGVLIEFSSQPGGEGATIWTITSLSIPVKLIIAEEADEKTYIIGYDSLSKEGIYLAGTVQFILIERGGICEDKLPTWAGKRWVEVKKNWKSNYLQ